jgi:hypothetical protein
VQNEWARFLLQEPKKKHGGQSLIFDFTDKGYGGLPIETSRANTQTLSPPMLSQFELSEALVRIDLVEALFSFLFFFCYFLFFAYIKNLQCIEEYRCRS